MPAQQTKNGMLSMQKYFRSTYNQHTQQLQAMKFLQTIHLLSKQISPALCQKTLTKKLTNIYVIALLQVVGMQMLWWALNTSIQRCVYIWVLISCVLTTSIWQIKCLEEMEHYVKYLILNWNTIHQVINTKSITEEKCGQSMQQMLNGWNVNTWTKLD